MDKVLKETPIGSEGKLKIEVKEGKLLLALEYDGKGLDGQFGLALDPEYFVDLLAAAIPGQLDDALLALLKTALKG